MSHNFLDAFQLLIAAYLFYTALKGSGTLYNFPEVPKKKQSEVHRNLRIIYAVGGVIALIDGLASMVQNTMYRVTYTESSAEVTQVGTISGLSFLTYDMLSAISLVCTILIVALLIGTMIYVKKQ